MSAANTCQDCERRLIFARGLCNTCYHRNRYHGTLIDFERTTHAADELLDEWTLLRDDGYGYRNAAARLGVTVAALDKALCRAKRRGDPRGSRVPFAHDMRQDA